MGAKRAKTQNENTLKANVKMRGKERESRISNWKKKYGEEKFPSWQTRVFSCHQTGWIGTVEVNWDAGLEPEETFCLCVSPGQSCAISNRIVSKKRYGPV